MRATFPTWARGTASTTSKGGWQTNQLSNDVNSTLRRTAITAFTGTSSYTCAASCTGSRPATFGYYRYRVSARSGRPRAKPGPLPSGQLAGQPSADLEPRAAHRARVRAVVHSGAATRLAGDHLRLVAEALAPPRLRVGRDRRRETEAICLVGHFLRHHEVRMPRGSFGGDVWKDFFFCSTIRTW